MSMKHQLILKLSLFLTLKTSTLSLLQVFETLPSAHDGGKLTVDVVGVDVLDGGAADISRLSSQSDPPQLVHPTQLETQTHKQVCELPSVCSDLTEGKMSTCNISAACFNTLLRKEMCFLNTVLNMKESIRGVCLPHSWRRCPAHWWRGEPSYRGAERGSGPSC